MNYSNSIHNASINSVNRLKGLDLDYCRGTPLFAADNGQFSSCRSESTVISTVKCRIQSIVLISLTNAAHSLIPSSIIFYLLDKKGVVIEKTLENCLSYGVHHCKS